GQTLTLPRQSPPTTESFTCCPNRSPRSANTWRDCPPNPAVTTELQPDRQRDIFRATARPVGVSATPPSPVSRSSGGSSRPTDAIALTTSSGGMNDSTPVSASCAAETACTL